MTDKDQMLDEANRLEADPPRSKLDDYAEIIWALRRKRKRICLITAFLNERGVPVGKSTVARWLKNHPVPKTDPPRERQESQSAIGEPRTALEKAARDFFKPSESPHENNEQRETKLWNRPD